MTEALAALPAPIPPAPAQHGRPRSAREAAQAFEAVFLQEMLKPMFAGIGKDPLFGGGGEAEMYRDFLVDALARALAEAGGIGVAQAVEGEIARLRGADEAGAAAADTGLAAYRQAAARAGIMTREKGS